MIRMIFSIAGFHRGLRKSEVNSPSSDIPMDYLKKIIYNSAVNYKFIILSQFLELASLSV
jgi:hypothetical protein